MISIMRTALKMAALFIVNFSVSSGDDFFGDEFNEEFDAMEDSDRFHDKLEDGFKNWEERQVSMLETKVSHCFAGVLKLVGRRCWTSTSRSRSSWFTAPWSSVTLISSSRK